MDESGDLGFDFSKAKTPKTFCITFVLTENERKLEKIVKRAFSDFTHQNIKHPSGVLHSYKETPRTKLTLLSRLLETDTKVAVVKADKKRLVRRDTNEFYNDLTILLLEKAFDITNADRIVLTASRKDTDESQNELFKESIKKAFGSAIEVAVKKPYEAKALQVVDCVSWGLFRYYEYKDDTYYKELKPILHEYDY